MRIWARSSGSILAAFSPARWSRTWRAASPLWASGSASAQALTCFGRTSRVFGGAPRVAGTVNVAMVFVLPLGFEPGTNVLCDPAGSKLQLKMRLLQLPAALVAGMLMLAGSAWAASFDLTDTGGKRHRLSDYPGRPVVLNYWATWCVPCIQEIPEIAEFQRAHPDVVVIGIALDAEDVS